MLDFDIELRKWCLQFAASEFEADSIAILEDAERFFQYVKTGKLPEQADEDKE